MSRRDEYVVMCAGIQEKGLSYYARGAFTDILLAIRQKHGLEGKGGRLCVPPCKRKSFAARVATLIGHPNVEHVRRGLEELSAPQRHGELPMLVIDEAEGELFVPSWARVYGPKVRELAADATRARVRRDLVASGARPQNLNSTNSGTYPIASTGRPPLNSDSDSDRDQIQPPPTPQQQAGGGDELRRREPRRDPVHRPCPFDDLPSPQSGMRLKVVALAPSQAPSNDDRPLGAPAPRPAAESASERPLRVLAAPPDTEPERDTKLERQMAAAMVARIERCPRLVKGMPRDVTPEEFVEEVLAYPVPNDVNVEDIVDDALKYVAGANIQSNVYGAFRSAVFNQLEFPEERELARHRGLSKVSQSSTSYADQLMAQVMKSPNKRVMTR